MTKRKAPAAAPACESRGTLIHPYSCPAAKSELILNHMPPTQASIVRSDVAEYRPLSSVTGDTPLIEFIVPAMADRYTDLEDMYLYVKIRYELEGKAKADVVAPVNNLLHSMFSKVELTLQDKCVTSSSQYYAYKAYLEKLLGFGADAKKTYARAAGWIKDSADNLNSPDNTRATAYKDKTTIELIDRLHLDLCAQERLLLPGVQIKLSLQTNKPSFYFHSSNQAVTVKSIKFEHVALFIKQVEVSDMQANAHRADLLRSPALYPISRNEIRQFVLSVGEQNRSLDNVCQGQLPRRMFVMIVKNAAENGDISMNPYNFEHFKLSYLAAYVNGDQQPCIPYTPNFPKNLCIREYFELFRSLNQLSAKPNLDITLAQFMAGHTIYGINLTTDASDPVDGHFNPLKRGNLRLDVRFEAALTSVLTVLVFLQFDSLISIDNDRNVYTDYK